MDSCKGPLAHGLPLLKIPQRRFLTLTFAGWLSFIDQPAEALKRKAPAIQRYKLAKNKLTPRLNPNRLPQRKTLSQKPPPTHKTLTQKISLTQPPITQYPNTENVPLPQKKVTPAQKRLSPKIGCGMLPCKGCKNHALSHHKILQKKKCAKTLTLLQNPAKKITRTFTRFLLALARDTGTGAREREAFSFSRLLLPPPFQRLCQGSFDLIDLISINSYRVKHSVLKR